MEITRGPAETQQAPAQWFTGEVTMQSVAEPEATSKAQALMVRFAPGARTAWHTHPYGQTIHVTEGVCRCQCEGGPVETLGVGDRAFFAAGENHWHGAAPDQAVAHLAIHQVDDDGVAVNWGELVSDEQYDG